VPARCGKGATAPLCPQGWCTPWPSMKMHTGSSTAQPPHQGWPGPHQASTLSSTPLVKVVTAPMATVRRMLVRRSIQRHQKVPTM